MDAHDHTTSATRTRQPGMSYKFQRLREKLRQAIASGELAGKLPGERALAKRFHVNAKTLSKALTDLAAEGLLDRSIGRGTYVKGSAPADTTQGRWLILCDAEDCDGPLVATLRTINPDVQTAVGMGDMRPSFLNQFSAVIDTASDTPEQFLRDLVVRSIPLVAVNREPRTYSMNTVALDVALGVTRLGRDLLLAGHRRLAAVEPRGSTTITTALRQAAVRYAADAVVEPCGPDEIETLIDAGVSGIVASSVKAAEQVKARLDRAGVSVPAQVSLTAIGCVESTAPANGYYATYAQVADAIVELLRNAPTGRPAALWLTGVYQEQGTLGPTAGPEPLEELARVRVDGMMV